MQGSKRSLRIMTMLVLITIATLATFYSLGTAIAASVTIVSGTTWNDTNGNPVDAHGGGMIKVGNTYYWIGQYNDKANLFLANACYSSTDLKHWTFVNKTLVRQASGDLGPNRIVERPKILYDKATKMYVETMHVDNPAYKDEGVGVATSPTVCGNYTYRGRLKLNGTTIKKWDSGSFQDTDGTGYIITHNGNIYKLAPDYLSAVSQPLASMCSNCEAPTLFKVGSTYFFLFSHRTGLLSNNDFYFTATSLSGPWTSRGELAPSGTNTWNSQTTYVLPVQGTSTTTYIYMGDRWSPHDLAASTYVWQPLVIKGTSLSMPTFHASWTIDTSTGKATF
jgi:Glycosyl hydrolases family 43